MSKNLSIKNLDFDTLKDSLKDFLKSQDEFSDYNFEGSGLTVLLDTLAYNAHITGYYTHMLANEAFVNSASQASSMNSHAKGVNYIPQSKQSSRATVTIAYVGGTAQPNNFYIPRGTEILSNKNNQDNRKFILTDDLYIDNAGDNITPNYISPELEIFEGSYSELFYTFDALQLDQRFIINDDTIDIKSLQLRVYENQGDTDFETWNLATDLMEINSTSKVYFISVNEDNLYEVFFGNGVYGIKPSNNNFIEMSYVSTSGEAGNGANIFNLTLPVDDWTTEITTIKDSDGGLERETVEDLRFNIPYHFRRQNRLVTTDDYKNIILTEYRNVNSINVWGGEDNQPVTYGQVFVCIKPKFGTVLSNTGKDLIKSLVRRYNMPTIDIQIIDPEYLYINLQVETIYNPLLTTKVDGEIQTLVNDAIAEYDSDVLTKFNALYSSANLANYISDKDASILSTQTMPQFERHTVIIMNATNALSINFLNEIAVDTVYSNYFTFRLNQSQLYDVNGVLKVRYLDPVTDTWKVYELEDFGTVDYTTGIVEVFGVEFNGFYGDDTDFILYATPVDRDFRTRLNNIIAINKVNTVIIKDYQG